jgi:hypothetical protein
MGGRLHMRAVVFGSYDGGGVSWLCQQVVVEWLGLVRWRCHIAIVIRIC